MPYDLKLAERVRSVLSQYPDWVEKTMFGGVGFLLRGNMACGVQGNELIVRVGGDQNHAALSQPYVRPFEGVPGRPMAGWVLVAPEGTANLQDLQSWVETGYTYASTLPEKA
jgi:TfoX/Sxy family transcriptional regulator of competence genes